MKAWACAPFVIILVLVYGLEEEGVLAIFCWKLLCFPIIFVWYNEGDYTLVRRARYYERLWEVVLDK